jgi:hypothetical protein
MNLRETFGKVNFDELLPNLLTLAYEQAGTKNIHPCSNCLCWCSCITFENIRSGYYAYLCYNKEGPDTTKTVMMKVK